MVSPIPLDYRENEVARGKNRVIEQLKPRLDVHNSEMPVLCQACEARHRGICGVLTPSQLVTLSKHTTKQVVSPEQQIAFEGETTKRFANILHGVVKLSKLTADGRQQIVGLQFAPDFMGRPFSKENDYAVEAATEVRLCSFPRSTLEQLTTESPELEHRLHQQTLKELGEAREWMLTLGRKSASERVASFLHFIAMHINPEVSHTHGSQQFEIPLKRSDIADFLGLTIETVSRQFTRMRQAGVIKISNNRTIEIPDMAKLAALTETNIQD
ncbi:MAG: Crp/Fnr family transcriptional regulator [Alphaproteobacteria bacterium]|nr:Crp/Fnr family transcriptional regulator [Alphaproteobacteria bacterium]